MKWLPVFGTNTETYVSEDQEWRLSKLRGHPLARPITWTLEPLREWQPGEPWRSKVNIYHNENTRKFWISHRQYRGLKGGGRDHRDYSHNVFTEAERAIGLMDTVFAPKELRKAA